MSESLRLPIFLSSLLLMAATGLAQNTPPAEPLDPLLPASAAKGTRGEGVPAFAVRSGYKVTLAAGSVANARFMEFDNQGILYLSQPDAGRITSYKYNNDGTVTKIADVVTGKRTVHGMHFFNGWLWFTTSGSIHKGKVRPDGSGLDELTDVIKDNGTLPSGGAHWWRPILVDSTGFYTEIGDPGNITDVDDTGLDPSERTPRPRTDELTKQREKIWRFNLDGTGKTLFAGGTRNTEKLRFRPGTSEVWGCDHGSDNFGGPLGEQAGRNQPVTDFLPGDELNLYEQGKFYGHPYIVGNNIPRIEFHKRADILAVAKKATPPALTFGAHWANNGFTFLEKDGLGMKGDMLVAFHGSWNDTTLSGYRIQRVMFDAASGRPVGSVPLVITLTEDGRRSLASPVDVAEAPDGSVLFTTDVGPNRRGPGAIYRLSLDK
jgi:glucose/arabinose dehydrogenase